MKIKISFVTILGEFPWMSAISKIDGKSGNYVYSCGGSLIHPSIIMTGEFLKKKIQKFKKSLKPL